MSVRLHRLRRLAGALSLLAPLWLLAPTAALAQLDTAAGLDAPPPRGARRVHRRPRSGTNVPSPADAVEEAVLFEPSFGTGFPLDVNAGVRVLLAERFFVTGTLGAGVYGSAFGAFIEAFGGPQEATVLERLLSGALVGRVGLGVRPFGRSGPDLALGYMYLGGSGDYTAAELGYAADLAVTASVDVHAIFVELAWNIELSDLVYLRPALGFFRAMGESVDVATTDGDAAEIRQEVAEAVETTIRDYGMGPTLGLSVGFRL